jgi:hypothetical protein
MTSGVSRFAAPVWAHEEARGTPAARILKKKKMEILTAKRFAASIGVLTPSTWIRNTSLKQGLPGSLLKKV